MKCIDTGVKKNLLLFCGGSGGVVVSNAWVFQHFLYCSTFLNVVHYQKPLCNLKNRLTFLWCSLVLSVIYLH